MCYNQIVQHNCYCVAQLSERRYNYIRKDGFMKRIFKGFTLAEVLVTLAIIGVVASVTLPALQVNVNKQALSTQISKTYSQLQEGLKLYMQNEGLDEFDYVHFNPTTFARNYLQVQYVCNGRGDTNCMAPQYTYINNSSKAISRASLLNDPISGGDNGFILKDGTALYMSSGGNIIAFDVNNKKGPNKVGYDYHVVYVNKDGSIGPSNSDVFSDPAKRDATIKSNLESCKKNGGEYGGMGCFAHLLRNNFKFDY